MDLDISSLWSWTLPLWGLFLIVFFLGGVLSETTILEGIQQSGGGVAKTLKKVRFAL